MIQNEKESKLLIEGHRTGFGGGDGAGAGVEGVVVQQPSGGLGEEMVMPLATQEEGAPCPVAELPAIMESVDERPDGSEAEAQSEDIEGPLKRTYTPMEPPLQALLPNRLCRTRLSATRLPLRL